MAEKPTYDDLEQRIKELEKERIESKRAEDALNDNEIKFQDLANSIDDIFFALDNDLNYTFWNKACSHLFGISPENMVGKSFFDFDFNKGYEWIADIYKEVIHHRQSRNFESSFSLGDKKIWYEIKAYPSSSGCAVLIKDITERKQAEKSLQKAHNELEKKVKQRTNELYNELQERKQTKNKLKESEENFRALIETIDDIVLVANPDGSIIYSNPAASSRLGYNQNELYKLKIIDLHPPYLRKEAAFIVSEMISGNQDVCPLPVLGKNGNLIPVETRVWLGKWNGTDCIFGISKDLSQEQEALQKFDQIFRMNPALMAVSKMSDQTFTDVNDAFLQTLGYSKEEIIGKSTLELNLFVNKEKQNQAAQMLSDNGHFRGIEMQVRTKQGGNRYGIFSGDIIETQGTKYFLTVMVDITQRKQAEAERKLIETALVHQKQRLSYILEGTNVGTWEWDVQTGETIFNERWANIIGYTLEEISPVSIETWIKFTHPDDLEVSNELLKKHFSNELDLYECEARMKHKDGTWVWVLDRGRVISRTKNGKPLMMMGTHQDITERKQAEENLISEHNRVSSILDVIPSGIYIVSQQGNIEYINPAIQEAFGPINGQKCYEYFHNLTQHCPWCKNKDVFSGKSVRWEWYSEKNQKYYDLFDAPIMNVDGSISKFEIFNDITALKLSEEKIKRSEEKYRSILHSMKDAAYICSQDFKIEYMNPAMIDRFGADAIGEHCYKTIYDRSEQCSWCVFDQIQKGEDINYEVSNPKDNCYYSVTNSPIFHVDGKVSKLTIFHDITEIKNIEAQLQQARKMESIGTLTGGIAHDFNNLLYMISGNTELALEDIPDWNPVHQNLQEIKTASLKAAGIVKQLLHFSRKTDQKLKPIGAVTVIKDSLKFLRSTIPSTIEIKTQIPDAEIPILADPIQINQIMMNLCINASHALEETGGILEIKLETASLDKKTVNSYPDLTMADNYLKITLSDTGSGIPPETINRIFDPYFTTKEFGKGSGMGLTVVQGIVKNHDGAITVDSQVGKGTSFTIFFPVIDEAPKIINKKTGTIPHGTERILFVDDEKIITNMMQQMLEKLGYHVKTSLNPEEALDLFKSKSDSFDIVITDMTMPQMTGATFAEKLKKIRSDIPVILCTGHSSLIDEDKAKQSGISGYVMKPVSMRNIAKAIREALDK